MGRPRKELSPKELAEVERMAAIGMTQELISLVKDIDEETLRKYARVEMKRGRAKMIAKIMQTGYSLAASGECPMMTKWMLEVHAGLRKPAPAIPPEIMELLREATGMEIEEDETEEKTEEDER